jgi:hypothetical protein
MYVMGYLILISFATFIGRTDLPELFKPDQIPFMGNMVILIGLTMLCAVLFVMGYAFIQYTWYNFKLYMKKRNK